MIVTAVTETNRRYNIDIDEGFWVRYRVGERPDPVERLWASKVGTCRVWPWDSPDDWQESAIPVVGKFLYISSRDVWYVSTVIVDVFEITDLYEGLDIGTEVL